MPALPIACTLRRALERSFPVRTVGDLRRAACSPRISHNAALYSSPPWPRLPPAPKPVANQSLNRLRLRRINEDASGLRKRRVPLKINTGFGNIPSV